MVKWRPIQISLTLLIHFSYSQYQEYPHWVRFSVNNIDKNRWFSFYCYFFASNVQLFERECQWFEFQRCERKRKMVNYRDKLSWTGNKWETLEMADSVFFSACANTKLLWFLHRMPFDGRYELNNAEDKSNRAETKKSIRKRKSLILLWKRMGNSMTNDDELKFTWNEMSHFRISSV